MARIKLDIPDNTLARIQIPIRITDINYGNHVGNDSIVSLIHESRVQWLQQHQFSELDIAGVSLIMGDLAIEYKNQSYYGDVIEVAISAGEISRVGFDLYYTMSTNRKGEKIIIAKAKTGMVCFNYSTQKVAAITPAVQTLLTTFL